MWEMGEENKRQIDFDGWYQSRERNRREASARENAQWESGDPDQKNDTKEQRARMRKRLGL